MVQYNNKGDDLSRCSNESEEDDEGEITVEELFKKPKKDKKRRKGKWAEHLANDLVDIILDNDKYKGKLLLTQVKNIKNSQYYHKVIEELKERCCERGEEFPFNVEQTICRDAVMKIKTSGIKHFQQDKEMGSWFGKLLIILNSMDICQLQQAIEPGRKAPKTNGEEDNPEESHDDDICEEEASQGSSSRSSDEASNAKRKYVPTPASRKKSREQTESLN